jgi:beta-lactamase superfamily II metal-dependent hydrolase
VAALLACLALAPGVEAQPSRGLPSDLRVSFIDVGQGDAIWIRTPAVNGVSKNIVIDGGPDRGKRNRLLKYLQAYGLPPGSFIDYLVATHPHDDHYPGLLDLFAQYQVGTLIHSGYPKRGEYQGLLRAARAEKVNRRRAAVVNLRSDPDFRLDWGGGVTARVLHADRAAATAMGSGSTRENNASTVIRVEFGAFSFLLMGDAEGKTRAASPDEARFVEAALLSRLGPGGLRATVLKAGHHGSETGSTLPFLQAVRPDIVVVMSGRRSYGGRWLPDETVLDRYAEVNPDVLIVRTDDKDEAEGRTGKDDQDGDDIYMRTDGRRLRVYQAVGADRRRYWRLVDSLAGGS